MATLFAYASKPKHFSKFLSHLLTAVGRIPLQGDAVAQNTRKIDLFRHGVAAHDAAARWFQFAHQDGIQFDDLVAKFKENFCGAATEADLARILRSFPSTRSKYPVYFAQVADAWLRIKDPEATDPTATEGDVSGLIRHVIEQIRKKDSQLYFYLTDDNKHSAATLYKEYFAAEKAGEAANYEPVFSAVWARLTNDVTKALNRLKLGGGKKKRGKKGARSESDSDESSSSSESSSDGEDESSSSSSDSDGKLRGKKRSRKANKRNRREEKIKHKKEDKELATAGAKQRKGKTAVAVSVNASPMSANAATATGSNATPLLAAPPSPSTSELHAAQDRMRSELKGIRDQLTKLTEHYTDIRVPGSQWANPQDTLLSALSTFKYGYQADGSDGYIVPQTILNALKLDAAADSEGRLPTATFQAVVRAADKGAESAMYRIFNKLGWVPMSAVPPGLRKMIEASQRNATGGPLPAPAFFRPQPATPQAPHGRGAPMPANSPAANAATAGSSTRSPVQGAKGNPKLQQLVGQAVMAMVDMDGLPTCEACSLPAALCLCATVHPNA